MNPYLIPGMRWHFNNLSDSEREERIRKAVNAFYGFDCVSIKYKQNANRSTVENVGRSVYCLLMAKHTKYSQSMIATFLDVDRTSVTKHVNKVSGIQPQDRQNVINAITTLMYQV